GVFCQQPPITVSEISRVMPSEGMDALDHHFKLVVSGVTFPQENIYWEFTGTGTDGKQFSVICEDCNLMNESCDLIFKVNLPDLNFIILLAKDASRNIVGAWSAKLKLRDLEARVAVIGSDNTNGFLRVQAGILNNVTVPNGGECLQEESPCYYRQEDLSGPPSNIIRCTDLLTNASEIIRHCDETYTEYRGLSEYPIFSLWDKDILTVNYAVNASRVELLLVDPTNGSQIINSNAGGVNCVLNEMESNTCSLEVKIPDGMENINFVVIPFNENDFTLGSETSSFEIFEISWTQLAKDAFMTTWTSSKISDFSVSLVHANVPDPLYQFHLNCGKEVRANDACEAFFTNIALSRDDVVIIQRIEDMNSVAMSIPEGENKPTVKITRIIKEPAAKPNIIRMDVNTSSEIPTFGRLVEVIYNETEPVNVVYNNEYNISIYEKPYGYDVECELKNYPFYGLKNYILLSYNASNDIQEVGLLYATMKEIPNNHAIVGNTSLNVSALWTSGGSEGMSVDGVPCEPGLCVILDYDSTESYASVCANIENTALGIEEIEQCVDSTPVNKEGMSIASFHLKDREDFSIAASFGVDAENVYVILFNESNASWLGICSPEDLHDQDQKCTGKLADMPLASPSSMLKALIVSESNISQVISSTAVEVEDLLFSFTKLFPDTITVKWTANNPEGYTTLLQKLTPPQKSRSTMTFNKDGPSDVFCMENTCSAFYDGVDDTSTYSVMVHRIGDSISETVHTILPSEVSDYVIVSMNNENEAIKFTSKAEEISNDQITFYHDIPIFDAEKEVSFVLVYYGNESVPIKRGRVNLQLKELDVKLAWVSPQNVTSRSLRVDVGSQDNVTIGTNICIYEDSPCYYLDDPSLPHFVERCEEIVNSVDGHTVLQCESEITPYTELKDLEVTLYEDSIKIIAPLDDPEATFEVTVYDPTDTTVIFSDGNATCNISAEATAWNCTQQMRTPSDRPPIKVLVAEIGPKGDVLRSAVKKISSSSTGVESWVIVVSVMASVLGVSIIAFVVIVAVRKKKDKKDVNKQVNDLSGVDEESQCSSTKRSLSFKDSNNQCIQAPKRDICPPSMPAKPYRRDSRQLDKPFEEPTRRDTRLFEQNQDFYSHSGHSQVPGRDRYALPVSSEPFRRESRQLDKPFARSSRSSSRPFEQDQHLHSRGRSNLGYEHEEQSQNMAPVIPRLNRGLGSSPGRDPAPKYY
ncbi:hypothetical protein SK128_016059, partial [Halocaridina rubra]